MNFIFSRIKPTLSFIYKTKLQKSSFFKAPFFHHKMTSIRVWGYRIPKLRERVLHMYLCRSFFTIIIDKIDRYQSNQVNTASTHTDGRP